ncbi:AAA family ATPase [Paraburkholderia sp. SIMBA_027]|uniref:AAA family ATPase n=1 Tax=Paraburkholderia sp. SIMBA_027 TaxID=3085770 RepID=UPI003978C288
MTRDREDAIRLGDDGLFVLARVADGASANPDAPARLVVFPTSPQPSTHTLAMLENAWAWRARLDSPRLTPPLEFVREGMTATLALLDPGGVPLSTLDLRAFTHAQIMTIAANVAQALDALHRRELVHNDLRPEHVLVDTATLAVALTGFGLTASPTPVGNVAAPPLMVAQALPYLAPERTGLVNRQVDARADLYALGIVTGWMLTGRFPYAAASPGEWLYCHTASVPVPLRDWLPALPETLDLLVARLLAKAAEDRYQTARGVEHDLRECADRLRGSGAFAPFRLGSADTDDRLLIPDRLYGRAAELDALTQAFERVARDGSTECVFISGYSGIGKSSLVEDFHRSMTRGRFASGKFDQHRRNVPYATIAQCLEQLLQRILRDEPREQARWRKRIQQALGPHGRLLVDLLPSLEQLVGPQSAVAEAPPHEALTRFVAVLTRCIAAFAGAGQPLVLFLDDLQWLDAGTQSILEALGRGAGNDALLIVGAYRENEVGAAHPLAHVIADLRARGARVSDLLLAPLTVDDIERLVRDATRSDTAASGPLARLMFERTGGNPFFAVQYLHALADDGYLRFDDTARHWVWSVEQIAQRAFPESVVDLMIGKIERLSAPTQRLLTDFACVGATASRTVLASVHDRTAAQIDATLAEAVEQGLVYRRAHAYAFVHDRVQEAAYALLGPHERVAAHGRIGRRLDLDDADPELDRTIFDIVNQYNRALSAIDDAALRLRVGLLNLRAAQRARAASAYATALNYLVAGSEILDETAWQTHYREKFSLELLLAECTFLAGNPGDAESRLRALAALARSIPEKAAVAFLRITLHTALDEMSVAVDICLHYLREVGVDWSAHPERAAAHAEYAKVAARVRERSIMAMLDNPTLADETLEATLNVFTAVLPPAFFTDENLVCLVLARMANLSMEHGNAGASSLGFAYLGMVAGPVFGDYPGGYEFGKLGMALVDEKGLDQFRARVYMCFSYHVMPWTQPIGHSLPILQRAFEVATESGDLTYIGFSSCCLVTTLLAASTPLAEVEARALERLHVVREAGFGLIVDIINAQLALIRDLRGTSPWFGSPDADYADTAALENHFEHNRALDIAACWYWIRQQQARYFAGDIEGALAAGARAAPLVWTSSGHFELAEYHFFSALAGLRSAQTVDAALEAHVSKVQAWAASCPANFEARAALLEAELACVRGAEMEAMRLYERAIDSARANRLLHVEALAAERAGHFYLARGFAAIAPVYLRRAREAYESWGASARVAALDAAHPQLAFDAPRAVTPDAAANLLDVESVVRASQAISSERVLDRLMHTLMTIVLEHTGARRALLVLPHEERLHVEAEAREGGEVRIGRQPGTPRTLPLTMLNACLRTHDALLVDDACAHNPFAADEYFQDRVSRSVLCLPLVKQTRVIGALYLENELAPGVFTPPRMTVLRLLASQAAISLENASLEQVEALLEEKDALLHEVHHRVKNNLQLISSLLNLQGARVPDRAVAELFQESRNRVRSMAMVHENLYRAGNFARIDMAPHIRNLCAHLARVYEMSQSGVVLDVKVDDVQLDMNRAIACGMIVNELVSNALKHAFPQGRRGNLRVTLSLDDTVEHAPRHADAAPRCILSVADDGVGLPVAFAIEEVDSLGLQLVHDLSCQLRGVIDISRHGGTCFAIQF